MPAHPPERTARPRRGRLDTRTLRADLRALLLDASIALVVTAGIYALLHHRIETGSSQTLMVMPFLDDAHRYRFYWACQAFGWSGLLWAWISVLLGLLRATAPGRWTVLPHAGIERWHRVTGITTVGLMLGHALAFLFELLREDAEGGGGGALAAFADVFVPGWYDSGTGQVAILLGLIAFYLAIPLGFSFYLRWWTGPRLWRVLHRFVIAVYVLSVWHTLLYGTNVWFDGGLRTAVWLLQLPVALLLLARLLAPLRPGERLTAADLRGPGRWRALARLAGRAAAALAVPALLLVAATGRDGGRTPGEETGDMAVTQPMVWAGLAVLLTVLAAAALAVRRDARAAGPGPLRKR
ncbi:ferric reductase-like transmembrane domain-containing protein [Nocardiopsis composta]|uniref:DMSO/TMAO reductase YedYZ heme-binding membrane subunit n=1 Tax=Nocardiopsis composta TaxID=157465 RepID=A0A7W8QQG4_9ACTN|nr:ferric reductase-like transmembrane domain-containing protein [Nocardiopsis composta]MBB5434040.1 DMSO/TMAO reductase YedYZ heme-binding membrane subunit [Nocardiopsis composta]